MLPRKPVNKEINVFYGVHCCFSGFFERLPLTEFQSDKKIRTIFEVRAYHIVGTSFMP